MNSNKNLTNNNNLQQITAKVNYFLKNKIISTKLFLLSSKISSLLDYFQKNISPQSKYNLKKEYIYNNSKIDLNIPLFELIQFKKNSSSSTIESVEIFIELEETKENINNNKNNQLFRILIQPKENPFGLYVYKIKEGIITLEQYPEKIIKKYELNKYSINYSSFCNSLKHLYISGGKINNDLQLNNFWIINNHKYSIIHKKMPYKKSNHSMIYICLDNKEYIFIAGGENNLMTFYYDINMDSFMIWSNMNKINIKPTLCQYKEYIYSFNSFNIKNNSDIFFERTNLVTGKPTWEKIVPKFDINKINFASFQNKDFSASKGANDDIIFCGGEDVNLNIYIYEPNKNFLLNKNGNDNNHSNIKFKLSDKIFYDINKEHSLAMAANFSIKKEIIVLNKIKQKIRLINSDIFENFKKVKLKEDLGEEKKSIGKIIVKAKIHERLRFEIQPEIVEAQQLFFDKKDNIINEKEIINIEYVSKLNKDDELYKKNNERKRKEKFYLSNDVFYNNFVTLCVEKRKKKK